MGALARRVAHLCIAGSPPRRAGNFLLRGQKKVTKEEALNRTRAPQAKGIAANLLGPDAQKRTAALSRLTCHERGSSHHLPVRRAAARRAHENSRMQRRSGDAVFAFPDEPGVQPALRGVKGRCVAHVIGTAARAKRVASCRSEVGCFRAPLVAAPRSSAVEGLFFGDFLLAPQKKVTPPPGGTPGNTAASQKALPRASSKPQGLQPTEGFALGPFFV